MNIEQYQEVTYAGQRAFVREIHEDGTVQLLTEGGVVFCHISSIHEAAGEAK